MPKLSESEIAAMLENSPEWELDADSGAIVRNLEFPHSPMLSSSSPASPQSLMSTTTIPTLTSDIVA